MANKINLYPETSCPCGNCGSRSFPMALGEPTNFSVNSCRVPPVFTCYSRLELSSNVQPQNKQGWYQLNPEVYTSKVAEGFDRINCGVCANVPDKYNNGTSYISIDPRLYSSTRADYLPLDRPPTDGKVHLKDVYNKAYGNYGAEDNGGFEQYTHIKDGDITYYIDKSIEDPFYHPVYSEPATATSILYQDPMSAMKPEYNRKALVNTENPTTTTPISYPYCLSSIQDTQSFREDLIALQQRKHNQEKWSARWGGQKY